MEATIVQHEGPAFAHPFASIVCQEKDSIRTRQTRVTIAYRTVGTDLEYGVAFCAPHDMFNRKLGRTIAEGRLLKHPVRISPVNLENPLEVIAGDIIANHLPWRWRSADLTTGE